MLKISAVYFMWNPEICQDPPTWGQDDLVLSFWNKLTISVDASADGDKEDGEITDDSILDDDQSDEIFNMVVEQMTSEEAEADQLTHGSYKWIIMHEKCGRPDSNGFQVKWRFGTHGNWKNQNPGGHFGATS